MKPLYILTFAAIIWSGWPPPTDSRLCAPCRAASITGDVVTCDFGEVVEYKDRKFYPESTKWRRWTVRGLLLSRINNVLIDSTFCKVVKNSLKKD